MTYAKQWTVIPRCLLFHHPSMHIHLVSRGGGWLIMSKLKRLTTTTAPTNDNVTILLLKRFLNNSTLQHTYQSVCKLSECIKKDSLKLSQERSAFCNSCAQLPPANKSKLANLRQWFGSLPFKANLVSKDCPVITTMNKNHGKICYCLNYLLHYAFQPRSISSKKLSQVYSVFRTLLQGSFSVTSATQ